MGTYEVPISLSDAQDQLAQLDNDLALNVNFGSGSLFGSSAVDPTATPDVTATASTSLGGNASAASETASGGSLGSSAAASGSGFDLTAVLLTAGVSTLLTVLALHFVKK